MSDQYTYTDAFNELKAIVSEIEQGEISIDELSQKVKRATALIEACKAKLTATEAEVNRILSNLDKESDTGQPDAGENQD